MVCNDKFITLKVNDFIIYYYDITSPFGYQTGVGGIDTYGVNHKGFSLRDEVEYQFARDKREQELMKQFIFRFSRELNDC